MKKSLTVIIILAFLSETAISQNPVWKPAGDKIKTTWADKIDPLNPLIAKPEVFGSTQALVLGDFGLLTSSF